MNPKIRKADARDISDVYDLICLLENSIFHRQKFDEVFRTNISNDNIAYYVAELDGKVIGFGSIYLNYLLHHCAKVTEIQELVVAPGFRGRNVGRQLIQALLSWSIDRHAVQIEVTCNIARKSAHAFYKKIGFVNTHKKFVMTPK